MTTALRGLLLGLAFLLPQTAHATDGDFVWVRGMGGTDEVYGNRIAVDGSGNVYTTGSFEGTADFDPGEGTLNLTSEGESDIFVQKLDASGNLVWARGMGGTLFDHGSGIAVDGALNVYTTGTFQGTVDFDPGAGTMNLTSAGQSDVFVQKLDASGNLVWARGMGGTLFDHGSGIAVDSAGNVYTTGHFYGTVAFDPSAEPFLLTSAGSSDIFVQKLDASGNLVWARSVGGTVYDESSGIVVDGAGNVYTTGNFRGTVDFDPGAGSFNLSGTGEQDIFVQKLDTGGNFVWARRMGGTGYVLGRAITVDGAGNVYATGDFRGTADFDPGAGTVNLTSAGQSDVFVQKLDSNGNLAWARSMGGSRLDNGYGIAVDGAGNVYTTGRFSLTVDFDPGVGTVNLRSLGIYDIFVQKLDGSGTLVWARGMGGTDSEGAFGIAMDGTGNVYTTGYFRGTADFDPRAGTVNLTSTGDTDAFVLKLGQDVTPPNTTGIRPSTEGPTRFDSVGFTVTFDEGVQNFNAASDLMIAHNGTTNTGATFSGGPRIYTVTIMGISGDGSFTLTVNTGSDVQDDFGNALATSVTSAAVVIDNTPPSVSIGAPTGSPINSSGTATYPVTVTGSIRVNLTLDDVTLNHSGTAGGSVNIVDGTTTTPSVEIKGVTGDGSYTISIGAGIASDAAGNAALATGPSADAVRVDNAAPTVTIGVPSGSLVTSSGTATYQVTISEASSINLTSGDVIINHRGTAGGSVEVLDGTSAAPTVQVSGVTGDGSYTTSIAAGIASDAAGNTSLASGPSSGTVIVDNTPPTVSIGAPMGSPVNSSDTATYPVRVGGSGRINLTSGAVTINHSGTAGGSVVVLNKMTLTPKVQVSGVTGDGGYTISIAGGIATDATGNASLAAGPSDAVIVDNTAPVFSNVVANPSEASEGDTVTIGFDSSEPIAGGPAVTVNGNPATRTAKAAFAYEYTVLPTDPLGPASIEIGGLDTAGNAETLINTTALTITEGAVEGASEGEGEGTAEGTTEGEGEGDVDGSVEGEGEGIVEGEDEGEGEAPPAGCGGCRANGAPMEKSLGDWLAAILGLAVLLGAHLRMQRQLTSVE